MKITVKEPFRKVQGEYELRDNKFTVIIGDNGCGKSSLLKAIKATDFFSDNLFDIEEINIKDFKGKIEIDTKYDVISYISKDSDFNLAQDAYTAVQRGLFEYRHLSSGEHFFKLLRSELAKGIIECKKGLNVLIMFDEIDSHFDLTTQIEAVNLLKKVVDKFGITILYTTHHLGVMLRVDELYYFETKKIVPSSKWTDIFIK